MVPKQEYTVKIIREQPLRDEGNEKLPDAFHAGRLLSVNQLCEMLGIHRRTLHRWVELGDDPPPSVKLGKLRKFPLDKVIWWIEKHAT